MKDPAFLFYSSDFLTGTMLLTDEQVGKYIRLMCVQHQKGHLSEKDMINICKTYDEDIFSKFSKDKDGLYFNERLEYEISRRRAYSESRSRNRKSKKNIINISSTYDEHMENEIENENKKKIKVLEYVSLTQNEIDKLKNEFGDKGYQWMIEKLNYSKGASGRTYKSDYMAIRKWVVDEYNKHNPNRDYKPRFVA